jgi:hypothetical protein
VEFVASAVRTAQPASDQAATAKVDRSIHGGGPPRRERPGGRARTLDWFGGSATNFCPASADLALCLLRKDVGLAVGPQFMVRRRAFGRIARCSVERGPGAVGEIGSGRLRAIRCEVAVSRGLTNSAALHNVKGFPESSPRCWLYESPRQPPLAFVSLHVFSVP